MRNQVRFAMHPDDEQLVLRELLREPAVVLIDGPRWKSSQPTTSRDIATCGSYCIIWSLDDAPELSARFMPQCNDWYCVSENLTIQFLRSTIDGSILIEGRFAVSTEDVPPSAAAGLERRFKALRKMIKKTYSNSVVCWQNPGLPFAPAGPSRSANPSKPDASLWLGPGAMAWMEADERRRIKQFKAGGVEGVLTPPPN